MESLPSSAPRHPIRVVALRTGLKPALIRAWENRYQTVGPERGKGRHRLYSDDDILRLSLLRQAVEGGRRISQVARLSTEQLQRIADEDTAALNRSPEQQTDTVVAPPYAPWQPPPLDTRRLLLTTEARSGLGFTPDEPMLQDTAEIRRLTERLNEERPPERRMSAGRLQALLLIQEFMAHRIVEGSKQRRRDLLDCGLFWLFGRFGRERIESTFGQFRASYDLPSPADVSHERPRKLLWLVFLWLANRNPAFAPYSDLFDDRRLESATAYRSLLAGLNDFFAEELGDGGYLLTEMRRCLEGSDSAEAQLRSLRDVTDLPASLSRRLGLAIGILQEENRLPFTPHAPPPPPPGPSRSLDEGEPEPEPDLDPEDWRLSQDQPWMAEVVLVAKNVLVWLAQLSRRFERPIVRLDQIPDEALQQLKDRGFNALWLVGFWQRSRASQRLKENLRADSVASAYAVARYEPAAELGGEEALEDLQRRCRRLGLRLTCDLVPNHTALDSDWVLRFPERFISVDEPPYPSYSFTGEDLSTDPDIGLWIEDGYRDFSNAAVVFKRLDRRTDEVSYLYHGNDGTALPWNDTAQLDYTRADVRGAVSDLILRLARSFPIIRLDAAMTLTKQHYQRLWFPEPGTGGAVPSRSEHGIRREDMDHRMPREFWAEIVERLTQEAPDVMLIAEAFWLMEPFFVRRLGVHRVYNSAFLHTVRDERNLELKRWLQSCLELEPAELQRYVNFLTTPDEDPAAAAFGKGDKLFAAATLLAVLPGTPLFGHGQALGLIEKYGMDSARPSYTESADDAFAQRHHREIAPILRHRPLFAGTDRLRLYDTRDARGRSLDAVYALTNGTEKETALALVNNSPRPVAGHVERRSLPVRIDGELRHDLLPDQAQAVDLRTEKPVEPAQSEEGLSFTLPPYGTRILLLKNAPKQQT